MGAFIIGVLVGWLAEFLFFTFFVKGKSSSTGSSGNSEKIKSLQTQLDSRNKDITYLKEQLASARAETTEAKATIASLKSAASSAGDQKPVASQAQTKTVKPVKATAPAAEAMQTKTASKPEKKTKPKPKTAAKPVAKKSVSKSPVKKATKAATKKTTVKKSAKSKAKGDDFTLLSGIGPSMDATLIELGIDSFRKLADMDDDILRDMLEASGARLNNNKEAMDSWNEQAELAAKGDMEGLKKLQESLKNKK